MYQIKKHDKKKGTTYGHSRHKERHQGYPLAARNFLDRNLFLPLLCGGMAESRCNLCLLSRLQIDAREIFQDDQINENIYYYNVYAD